jgi:uncharacterized protein with HEPN domain
MSKRDTDVLLEDIDTAVSKIFRYTASMSKSDFLEDEKTVDAVIRNLEIVGEAIRHLPETYKAKHQDIPWAQIVGMRNRIVHDYAGVDLEIVWQVVTASLPEFRTNLIRAGILPLN